MQRMFTGVCSAWRSQVGSPNIWVACALVQAAESHPPNSVLVLSTGIFMTPPAIIGREHYVFGWSICPAVVRPSVC